jgi:hypothetical protein
MALPSDGVASALDNIAERIRAATDHGERAAANVAFRTVCKENAGGALNPAQEAANRNITLMNPL